MGNSPTVQIEAEIQRMSNAGTDIDLAAQPIPETCCLKNVLYIKKHFHDNLLPEQRKRLENLEKLIISFSISCMKLGIDEQEHELLFKSVHDQLKNLRREVENMGKKSNSDYESLMDKIERQKLEKLDIFETIDIPRCDNSPLSLLDLNNINFSILSQTNGTLCYLAGLALKNTSFVIEQGIKSSKIDQFINLVCLNYNITAYHNFSHGFSVFLMAHQAFTLSSQIKQYVNSQELFFLLISCLSHDLNHKGKNNMYYVKTKSEKAQIYSNTAVLENMHHSFLFRLLDQKPEADILNFTDAALKTKARKQIIKNILATDMSMHFSSLQQFKKKCQATTASVTDSTEIKKHISLQKQREQDRQLVSQMVIHASDIGNPCLQFKNFMNWGVLLAFEFNEQHKKEISLNLQPTPFLKYVDRIGFYRGQIGFCKTFAYPLWKQLSTFSPVLKMFSQQIEENISILQNKVLLMI